MNRPAAGLLIAVIALAGLRAQAQDPTDQPSAPVAPISPPAGGATQAPAAPPPAAWQPRETALLTALDKIDARSTALSVPVGQAATFGSLSITVRACLVRPPGQAPDATAFLDVADAHPAEPGFHGWMIASAPAVSMLEHPVYDVRVTGCR